MFGLDDLEIPLLVMITGSGFLCLALQPLARRFGWVDRPAERKIHQGEIPLVGGMAIFVSLWLGIALVELRLLGMLPLLVAASIVFVAGLVDDRHHLSARTRFVIQACACLVMVFSGNVVLVDFGHLLWDARVVLGWISIPVTVFCVVGVINAFNMIDGMDGLSGSIFIVAAGSMFLLAVEAGRVSAQVILLLMCAATLGFVLFNARLPWNRRARIFLGDSGSTLMGFVLGWYFIDLSQGSQRAFAPVTALWLFALPLLDTVFLLIRRLLEGKSPFQADREHLHHAFLRAGFSVPATWLWMIFMAVLLAAVGLFGEVFNWPEFARFYAFLVLAAIYYQGMNRAWKTGSFMGRSMT